MAEGPCRSVRGRSSLGIMRVIPTGSRVAGPTGRPEAELAKVLPLPSAAREPIGLARRAGDPRLAGLEVWLLKLLACQAVATAVVFLALHPTLTAVVVGHVVASMPAGRRAVRGLLSSRAGRWLEPMAPTTAPQRVLTFLLGVVAALATGALAGPMEVAAAAARIAALRLRGAWTPGWWVR